MPKPRILEQKFWNDVRVAKLNRNEKLLFIGMVTLADDFGRLEADPMILCKEIFGYDRDVTVADVAAWRDTILTVMPNAHLYTVEEQEYIWLAKYAGYQNIRYRAKSTLPRCTLEPPEPDEPEPQEVSAKSSKAPKHAAKPETETETETAPKRAATPMAIPLPPDFHLTDDMRQWAKAEHLTDYIDLDRHTREYTEYWRDGEGQGKCKKNWLQAWRTWMRRAADDAQARGVRVRGTRTVADVGDQDTPPEGYSYDKDAEGRWIHLGGDRSGRLPYGARTPGEVTERHKLAAQGKPLVGAA